MTKPLLEVDPRGLARTASRRGKAHIVYELLSNALDQNVEIVRITLEAVKSRPEVVLMVEDDDPEGFSDLAHAYTLFGLSPKSGNAEKRGRFDIGEKLVIAQCEYAEIETTKGAVAFNVRQNVRTEHPRQKRAKGSLFSARIRMTREEFAECCEAVRKVILPSGVDVYFNGERLPDRKPLAMFHAKLPTEFTDESGAFRRSVRNALVEVYEPHPGEEPSIYEMGIPVVETSDRWHININQRVPLNVERDNVTPAFLRQVRTLVVNEMHERLSADEAAQPWVGEALGDKDIAPEAVKSIITARHGEKVAVADPSDPESRMAAISKGFEVIQGGHYTAAQHENIRKAAFVPTTSEIAPSRKMIFGPDGKDTWIPEEKWTAGMRRAAELSKTLAVHLFAPITGVGTEIEVGFISDITERCAAAYGNRRLVFNVGRLGHAWFERFELIEVLDLIVHEFGHEFCANHLDEKYHEALTRLAGRLAVLALARPEIFGGPK